MAVIYLDMDGVLFDFDGEVQRLTGKSFQDLADTPQERWDILHQYPHLYAQLKPKEGAYELAAGVEKVAGSKGYYIGVLTAVPSLVNFEYAMSDKIASVHLYFPNLTDVIKFGPHAVDKQKAARSGDILIDDSHLNIRQWNAAGGTGIQYHGIPSTTLTELNEKTHNQYTKR